MAFFAHFDLDLASALAEQLVEAFDTLDQGALTTENVSDVPSGRGVYQLFRKDTLVYIGKTHNLRSRLTEHREKIEGRQNIDVNEMAFKCLTVPKNWTPFAHEESLIKHYKDQPGHCEWNGNGFGPHDPGKERDSTNKPPEGFDSQFPIRENWACVGVKAGVWSIEKLLVQMKKELPYLLRYGAKHEDLKNKNVEVPKDGMSAIELLTLVTKLLPGWQATRFPSHLILYKENREFKHGVIIWHQPSK